MQTPHIWTLLVEPDNSTRQPQSTGQKEANHRVARTPLVVVALLAIVSLAVAEQMTNQTVVRDTLLHQELISAAPGSDASAGVWYCSEGTSLPGEFAEHSVVIANPSAQDINAMVTVFASTSTEPKPVSLQVSARSQASLHLSEVVAAQFTAALVEVSSGIAVVTQRVQGPTGFDVVPCATRSSQTWHFPTGSTRRDARLLFSLFNPFPTRAVAEFSFITDDGPREPRALRGVLVPARSLVVVDVTAEVPRFESLATTINVLAGRLVAGRMQVFDGSDGLEGLIAGPGIPQAHAQWLFPNGPAAVGIVEHLMLYNPTQQAAQMDITIHTDAISNANLHPPFEVVVPPQQRVTVVFDALGNFPVPAAPFVYSAASLIPKDSGFWVEVFAYNGVPIAAERVGAAAALASPAGVALDAGVVARAYRHLIAANESAGVEVGLVVVNPSAESIARISVATLTDGEVTPIEELTTQEVAPLGRIVVPINELVEDSAFAVIVDSSLPVVVTKSLLAFDRTGLSSAAAVPYNPLPL